MKDGQIDRYGMIRAHAKVMALHMTRNCPPSPELTLAIRRLQECVMFANASIAIHEA